MTNHDIRTLFDDLAQRPGEGTPGDLGFTATFTATLSEDPHIEAMADLGFTGQVEGVTLVHRQDGVVVTRRPVDEDEPLWASMQTWLQEMADEADEWSTTSARSSRCRG